MGCLVFCLRFALWYGFDLWFCVLGLTYEYCCVCLCVPVLSCDLYVFNSAFVLWLVAIFWCCVGIWFDWIGFWVMMDARIL